MKMCNFTRKVFCLSGPVKRIFWGCIVSITVIGLLVNLYAVTYLFANYNVSVNIALQHEKELIFPAVTVCNMSPVRQSAVNDAAADVARRKRRKRKKRSTGMWIITPWGQVWHAK